MKQIFIAGAGLSSASLIEYLLKQSTIYDWKVIVGDYDISLAQQRINGHQNGQAISFDVFDQEQRNDAIRQADIVISMLPASMHIILAEDCVIQAVDMVTASYVSDDIAALNERAIEKGVILLNETGLDPGIDHMSAKKVIDDIQSKGGKLNLFKSFCGGLVSKKYDTNPWNYKFTWNPRNVVLAGQQTAQFKRNGMLKYIPYNKLFSRLEDVYVDGEGHFESYANRDSLSYKYLYGLDDTPTILRGTLRRPGFCKAWDVFVQLGMTDDSFEMHNLDEMTWRDFTNSFLIYDNIKTVEEKLQTYLSLDDKILEKLVWLGIFSDDKIGLSKGSPAHILQHLLQSKWSLEKGDKDVIVMQHIFEYILDGKPYRLTSSLVVEGKDTINTAMSMTVGLPVAIATELILNKKISLKGVQIPVHSEIYTPILEKLKAYGIDFHEKIINQS